MTVDEITERVIGCCFRVHKALGEGFLEKVYENALMIELESHGLKALQQVPLSVSYEGRVVGEYLADILVEDRVVCELKANQSLAREHEIQLVNYLSAARRDVGLLINFGRSVTVRRKFREYRNRQDSQNTFQKPATPAKPVNTANPPTP
ncbi:MAG TPA: GxxExxY protein [Burkholderiales bacterium]|nr:GxxExxY protein [Burkholderiales bacterium]